MQKSLVSAFKATGMWGYCSNVQTIQRIRKISIHQLMPLVVVRVQTVNLCYLLILNQSLVSVMCITLSALQVMRLHLLAFGDNSIFCIFANTCTMYKIVINLLAVSKVQSKCEMHISINISQLQKMHPFDVNPLAFLISLIHVYPKFFLKIPSPY